MHLTRETSVIVGVDTREVCRIGLPSATATRKVHCKDEAGCVERASAHSLGRLTSGGQRPMMATDSVQPILNAILEIGETFAATLRLEAVLDSVIESGMRLAGGDSGSVML